MQDSSFGDSRISQSLVSFFEYLEKIELYYSKKNNSEVDSPRVCGNNSENVFRELKNSKVLF